MSVNEEFVNEFGSMQWFLFTEGLTKQNDTWWGKKINQYVERIKNGEFGTVKAGWFENDYGAKIPYFTLYNKAFGGTWYLVVKVTESGIFYPSESGGWFNLTLHKAFKK